MNTDLSFQKKAVEMAVLYSRYFIENKNVFQLIFLEDLGKQNFKKNEPEIIKLSQENLIESLTEELTEEPMIDKISAAIEIAEDITAKKPREKKAAGEKKTRVVKKKATKETEPTVESTSTTTSS